MEMFLSIANIWGIAIILISVIVVVVLECTKLNDLEEAAREAITDEISKEGGASMGEVQQALETVLRDYPEISDEVTRKIEPLIATGKELDILTGLPVKSDKKRR